MWRSYLPGMARAPRVLIVFACLSLRLAQAADAPAEKAKDSVANSTAACLECHRDEQLKTKKAGRLVSLFADRALLAKSAHRSLECTDCHDGFDAEQLPHQSPLKPVDCAGCHENTGRKHSFHPRLALSPAPASEDTNCAACHGTHAIANLKSASFPFARAQQTEACGRCHLPAHDQFLASAHGRAAAAGMAEAPACLDCHRLPVARQPEERVRIELKLAQTTLCESCHLKTIRGWRRGRCSVRSLCPRLTRVCTARPCSAALWTPPTASTATAATK